MVRFEVTIRTSFWADRSRWPAQFLYYCETMALVFDQHRSAARAASGRARSTKGSVPVPAHDADAFETTFRAHPDVLRIRRVP